MKMVRAIRKQAATAEPAAVSAADAYVADQMRSLAKAFKAQADVMKRKTRRKSNEHFRSKRGVVPTGEIT